jgi:hypothetical protein
MARIRVVQLDVAVTVLQVYRSYLSNTLWCLCDVSSVHRPVLKIILLGGLPDRMTSKPPYGRKELGRNEEYTSAIFFMLKFCLYLSLDWCFASTSCTMYHYSLNFCNIKSLSVIEISANLRFLHCVYMGRIGLLVWANMHGDFILSNDV